MKSNIARKIILSILLSVIPMVILGCGTLLSPLHDEDIAMLAGHKKYPLKIAVVANNFTFTPDRKRGSYYYGSKGNRYYCDHSFYVIPACKDFFPKIFDKVDFYDSLSFDVSKYDLIASLIPTSVTDITKNSEKSVELFFHISVRFRAGRELLWEQDIHTTGTSSYGTSFEKSQDKRLYNYSWAAKNATRGVFILLGSYLTYHPNEIDQHVNYLASLKQKEIEKQTSPANLTAQLQYSDKSSYIPNSTIDAAEQSTITATITNNGKGTAFDVKLETKSPYKNINFPKTIKVGDIPPGESKKVNVSINAALDLEDGVVPFNIQAKEKRGYDSKRYTLNVPAACLDKPMLVVTGYKINDGNTGLAKGNGNGIPENGETIEIISFVKNTGVGSAIKVNLSLDITTNGIVIERKEIVIPKIMPGQTVTGNLAFSIPRTFSGGEIRIDLAASDIRGASDAKKLVALNTESHQPVLAYTYKIIDRNKDGFLENGEEGEIEILLSNKGRMDASDIRLDLDSDDIVLSKKEMSIDRISAQSKYVPIRFAFNVPRTLEKDSIDISIKFRQKDFQGLNDTINVPVRLVVPDFQITHQILDPNNNGIIEQGETIDLIVKIRNVGGLDAEDVVLNLDFNKPGVILSGEKQVSIGCIPAGGESEPKTFTIHVQRRASQGTLPVQFAVTQKSFKNKTISLALAIAKEQAEVITVAGRNKSKKSYSIDSAGYNMAPIIVIASPRDNKRVASSSEVLTDTVADDRGVANIEIFVNGKRLDATRSISVVGKPGQSQKEREFRAQIPLQKGKNEITVTALDIENLSSSKSVTIYRESQRGEIWAAVIGINRYQNSKISLKYARNDAEAFAGYLRNHMGLDDKHLFELYDDQASLRNIRSVLGTKLRRKADRPEDTVFIFFAGHGAPLEDYTSKDSDGISKYILPHDADLEDIYSTALPMDEIARIFSAIRAERVIFIADSCYSGGVGGRTILSQGRRAKLSDAFLNRIAQAGKGRIILTSSNANEVSQESDKLRHGYFTYYLLEGLKGKADVDGDRLIDIDEIYRYLNKQVPERTKGAQHPVKKGEAEGHVIIGRVR